MTSNKFNTYELLFWNYLSVLPNKLQFFTPTPFSSLYLKTTNPKIFPSILKQNQIIT
jgi:hypothetical protein